MNHPFDFALHIAHYALPIDKQGENGLKKGPPAKQCVM
jgi:hypothetical protein